MPIMFQIGDRVKHRSMMNKNILGTVIDIDSTPIADYYFVEWDDLGDLGRPGYLHSEIRLFATCPYLDFQERIKERLEK